MTACDLAESANPGWRTHGWTLRAYQPGDEQQIVSLFQTCFHRPITEAHWRWKLRGCEARFDNVWVAESGGRIIGHFAAIPVRVWINGAEHVATVAVDSMVHPDYQGRWVFMRLFRHAHQAWRASGVTFLFGLPNDNWGSARKRRLGIRTVFSLTWKIRPFHVEHLLARYCHLTFPRSWKPLSAVWNRYWDGKPGIGRTIELTPVTQVTPEFDELWQTAKPHLRASIIRDGRWIDWRYLASPERKYRVLLATRSNSPVGYVAYRIAEHNSRVALLAELFVDPSSPDNYPSVLAQVARYFRQLDVDAAVTLAIPGTPIAGAMDGAGFRFRRGGSFDVCMVPFVEHLDPTVYDPQAWYMAGGDFDVI